MCHQIHTLSSLCFCFRVVDVVKTDSKLNVSRSASEETSSNASAPPQASLPTNAPATPTVNSNGNNRHKKNKKKGKSTNGDADVTTKQAEVTRDKKSSRSNSKDANSELTPAPVTSAESKTRSTVTSVVKSRSSTRVAMSDKKMVDRNNSKNRAQTDKTTTSAKKAASAISANSGEHPLPDTRDHLERE